MPHAVTVNVIVANVNVIFLTPTVMTLTAVLHAWLECWAYLLCVSAQW